LVVVLAGLAVGLGLPLLRAAAAQGPAGTRAVRLVAANGKRLGGQWQAWANASLVPTVAGQVTVRLTGCPGLPKAAGCVYTKNPRVVYLRRDLKQPRAVLLHELGHVYDLTVMSNSDRGAFRRIMRRPHSPWWKGNIPLAEWFAEAYSWCARHARIASVDDYAIYSYDPSPRQHRDTCALIRRAARDKTPPAPPPTPPIVTEDPAPPAAPPVAPTVVPGDPVRDPGPSTTPTPTPRATALPTVRTPTPTPSPTRTPTPTPEPTPEPTPDPTETPTPTPEPEPTETPTPTPTPEPEPTETPTPTETPRP
jgi:hypothetical protein